MATAKKAKKAAKRSVGTGWGGVRAGTGWGGPRAKKAAKKAAKKKA